MVLNGTRNVPEGEFVRRLERAGLKFGPDTNASTDFEEMVFKLDLPKSDDATVGEALFLLREVADEATLDTKAIDSERGIILSEEQTRGTPDYRAFLQELEFLYPGQRLVTRLPIGNTDVIRNAPRERFVEYYEGYFRPERATLIAVGDFDPAAMEAKIVKQFGSWQGEGPALPAVAQDSPSVTRGREARLFVEPGLGLRVGLNWVRPDDLRPDTTARRREALLEGLGMQVLNRRLQRIATEANPPFIGAQAASQELADSAERTFIGALAAPGKADAAIAAITQEQRRLAQFGVTQAELDREISEVRTAFTNAAAGAATRNSRVLAEGLVATLGDGGVFTTPAGRLAFFESVATGLTPDAVNAAVRALFTGAGPLIYMTAPAPLPGGDAALLAAYDRAAAAPVTAPVAVAAKAWPYQSFGTPGTVVERRELGDGIGATAVRFANGTRLTVKKTAFKDDEILVSARFGGGRLSLAADGRPSPEWAVGPALIDGGLGKLTNEEVTQALTGRAVGIGFVTDVDSFRLAGGTRPQDFGLQMQRLAAQFTDSAWRPTGWDRYRAAADTIHDSVETTPGGVFGRDAEFLLAGRDRRWGLPTRAEMKAMDISVPRAAFGPAFGRGPVEVTVVGDVDIEEAIRQTAATFGALPAANAGGAPNSKPIRFPAATAAPVRLTHRGRADQGLGFIAWPTTGFYNDIRRSRTLGVLAEVIQLRLNDEIREKQGTTYSPQAGSTPSPVFDDYGYLSATILAPPDKLAGFLRDAERIAKQLRDVPVTPDELERARKPLIADIVRDRGSSNAWWLGNLAQIQTDPRVVAKIRSQTADYEAVTPAALQKAARDYLVDARDWQLIVVPEAAPAGAPVSR